MKALDNINKNAKKKIAFFGDDVETESLDVIPTGIIPLDMATGIGGIPRGRVTDIFGLQSVGKSSLCYNIIAQAQKIGLRCALVDAEYSYSPQFVSKFGVSTKDLIIIQPDFFEQAAEAVESLIRDKIGLIVIDSVSAMVPRAEAEAESGKSPMAIQARLMSQMMRKIVAPLAKNNTALITLNQQRINIMGGTWDQYTVTGGLALKFYSTLRLEVKRVGSLASEEDKKDIKGQAIKITIKKNKAAVPGAECVVNYFYDSGFDAVGDLMDIAEQKGLIQREGNTYRYGEHKLGVGREKATAELENFREEILSQFQLQPSQESEASLPS